MRLPILALTAALLLGGCGGEDEPEPAPTTDVAQTATFGQGFRYPDGVSVTVFPPRPYRPTYPGATTQPETLAFDVVMENNSAQPLSLSLLEIKVQAGDTEGEELLDTNGGLGKPTVDLLPGRRSQFKVGFGLAQAGDLVVQVRPNLLDYEPATFTS